MKILAHRGGMGRAPENSMIGFKRALEDGADCFECDAMFTRDKEPVIMHVPFHSSSIHRQTGKRIYLDQINWKDLSGIKALGEPIVHLNELLEFVSNNKAICVIEPKRVDNVLIEKVINAIKEFKVEDRVEMISWNSRKENLLYAKKMMPRLKTTVITLWPIGDWVRIAKNANADAIVPGWDLGPHWLMFDKLLIHFERKVADAHAKGIEVHLGLANTTRDIVWAAKQRPDRIYSDDVAFLRKILNNHD